MKDHGKIVVNKGLLPETKPNRFFPFLPIMIQDNITSKNHCLKEILSSEVSCLSCDCRQRQVPSAGCSLCLRNFLSDGLCDTDNTILILKTKIIEGKVSKRWISL